MTTFLKKWLKMPVILAIFLLMLAWFVPLTPRYGQTDNQPAPPPLVKIDKEHLDAVVYISVFFEKVNKSPNGRDVKRPSWNYLSGFIFDDGDQKRVLSNAHLTDNGIDNIKKIVAHFRPGTKLPEELKLLGYDRQLDIALLEFINPEAVKNHPALKLGSSKGLKLLQKVISIGHPNPLLWAADTGVINNLRDAVNHSSSQPELIIHDCHLNSGSSGSPLLSEHYEVVGVNRSLIYPGSGFGFSGSQQPVNIWGTAVPIDDVKFLLPKLRAGGEVKHLHIGIKVYYSNFFDESELSPFWIKKRPINGLMVIRADVGTLGARAGLWPGDVIVSCNGQKPKDLMHLLKMMYLYHDVKDPLILEIDRFGEKLRIDLNIKKKAPPVLRAPPPPLPLPEAPKPPE